MYTPVAAQSCMLVWATVTDDPRVATNPRPESLCKVQASSISLAPGPSQNAAQLPAQISFPEAEWRIRKPIKRAKAPALRSPDTEIHG
mmetsp:Transcript_14731/g.21745  ORF Transcript_14731/g.21745 Transcript_14731/m.21745 type:complete len:88 (-) Transcript_14731:724-987(-)